MHNGSLETLENVVAFYNRGGDALDDPSVELKPLSLTDAEQADLVEFLKQLAGDPIEMKTPELPNYELRQLGSF